MLFGHWNLGLDNVFHNFPKTRTACAQVMGGLQQQWNGLAFTRELLFIYFLNQLSGIAGQVVAEHNKSIFKLRIFINFK